MCTFSLSFSVPPSFSFLYISFMYFFPAITMYTFYFFSCPFSLKKKKYHRHTNKHKKSYVYAKKLSHTYTRTLSPALSLFFFLIYIMKYYDVLLLFHHNNKKLKNIFIRYYSFCI
ncbi:hypothetical protein BDF21DRAFT_85622 [Thamnidium elegans]|nr:hypothetical protein BDF21DRAFT_85622 [Thamnidium elegans]